MSGKYISPEINIIEIHAEQSLATSLGGARNDRFSPNDGHDEDYWNDNEVDL